MKAQSKTRPQPFATAVAITLEGLENRQLMSASIIHEAAMHLSSVPSQSATVVTLQRQTQKQAVGLSSGTSIARSSGTVAATVASKAPAAQPKVDGNVTGWTNVSSRPLFSSAGPSPLDIRQGAAADCYFLSALAEEAYKDPSRVRQEVSERRDGTYDVYFWSGSNWVDEHIDGYLPTNRSGGLEYAGFGQGGCTWVAIMEKAFTYFRYSSYGASYSYINYGWPSEALTDLGGYGVYNYSISSFGSGYNLASSVYGALSSGYGVELATSNASGPLVKQRAYSVMSVYQDSAGNTYLLVRNPWGTDGPNRNGYQWVNTTALLPQLSAVTAAIV